MRSSAAAADVANSNLPGKSRRQRNCGRPSGWTRMGGETGDRQQGVRAGGRRRASEYRARLISSPIGHNNALFAVRRSVAPSACLPACRASCGEEIRGGAATDGDCHLRRIIPTALSRSASDCRSTALLSRERMCDHVFFVFASSCLQNRSVPSSELVRVGRFWYFARRMDLELR